MHSGIIVRNALTVKGNASRNASYRTKKLVKIRCPTIALKHCFLKTGFDEEVWIDTSIWCQLSFVSDNDNRDRASYRRGSLESKTEGESIDNIAVLNFCALLKNDHVKCRQRM